MVRITVVLAAVNRDYLKTLCFCFLKLAPERTSESGVGISPCLLMLSE